MERDTGRGVPLYAISVAAELVGTGQQNLRLYERRGLLEPGRTGGGTRRYSEQDLDTLRRISALLDAGLNLAGIRLSSTWKQPTGASKTSSRRPGPGGAEPESISARPGAGPGAAETP